MATNSGKPSPYFELIEADDLESLPVARLMNKTHLVAEGFNVVYGPAGSFKSFYALGIALSLAQTDRVVYVAAEGINGYLARVKAWCEFHKLKRGHLAFIREEVNLLDTPDVTKFVNTLKRMKCPIRLVIFDTYARCIPGGNENEAKDTGLAIRHCATIQRTFKTAILIIHHANKAETSERGSGALRGAADAMIEVSNTDDVVRVECSKMKDWEPWPTEHYRFQPVGSSGLLLPADDVAASNRITSKEIRILEVLNYDVFETCGATAAKIHESTAIPRTMLYFYLSKLKSNDLITQGSRGDPYKLNDNGRTTLYAIKPMVKKQPGLTITMDDDDEQKPVVN